MSEKHAEGGGGDSGLSGELLRAIGSSPQKSTYMRNLHLASGVSDTVGSDVLVSSFDGTAAKN